MYRELKQRDIEEMMGRKGKWDKKAGIEERKISLLDLGQNMLRVTHERAGHGR